jgi:hypothetical protein
MEAKIKEMFGDIKESGLEGGEIDFSKFWATSQKSQQIAVSTPA